MYLWALLHLRLHSRLNAWFQWIWQRQLQEDKKNYVWGFGAAYIRDLTVFTCKGKLIPVSVENSNKMDDRH